MSVTIGAPVPRPLHLVGLAEIAAKLGVSQPRAHQVANDPRFPKPVAELKQGRVWREAEVDRYVARHRKTKED